MQDHKQTYVQPCLCNNHRRERGKKRENTPKNKENKNSPNSPSRVFLFQDSILKHYKSEILCVPSALIIPVPLPSADMHFIMMWALPLCNTMMWTLPLSSSFSHNTLWPLCLLNSCHWDPSSFSTSPVIMLLWSTHVLLKGIDAWERSLGLIVGLGGIRIGYLIY